MAPLLLADVRSSSALVVSDTSAPRNARLFATAVLAEWNLRELAGPVCAGIAELSAWAVAHTAPPIQKVTLVWDGPLVFAEISDDGDQLPYRPVWLATDEGFAVALLEDGASEWDVEQPPGGGRCLWASYRTGIAETASPSAAE